VAVATEEEEEVEEVVAVVGMVVAVAVEGAVEGATGVVEEVQFLTAYVCSCADCSTCCAATITVRYVVQSPVSGRMHGSSTCCVTPRVQSRLKNTHSSGRLGCGRLWQINKNPQKNPPNEAKFCIFLGYLGSLGLAEAIFRFCRVFCLICQLHGGPADSRADQVRQIMAGFN